MAKRKAPRTASTIGDVLSQYNQLKIADINDVMALHKTTLAPFPLGAQVKVCAAHMVAPAAGTAGSPKVTWTRNINDGTCPTAGSAVTPPAGLIEPDGGLVMSRVTYTYKSPVSFFLKKDIEFSEVYYLRPRLNATVTCTDCPLPP